MSKKITILIIYDYSLFLQYFQWFAINLYDVYFLYKNALNFFFLAIKEIIE